MIRCQSTWDFDRKCNSASIMQHLIRAVWSRCHAASPVARWAGATQWQSPSSGAGLWSLAGECHRPSIVVFRGYSHLSAAKTSGVSASSSSLVIISLSWQNKADNDQDVIVLYFARAAHSKWYLKVMFILLKILAKRVSRSSISFVP